MKIVDAGYEILDNLNGEEILKKIERVARVCYKSEDKITEGSAEKMVRALIKSNHMAMLEHYSFSVKFICDSYNGDAGLTGRIADIKDAVIYVDAGTLFHSNIVAITLDTVLYVAKAEHEHIEDMRRA